MSKRSYVDAVLAGLEAARMAGGDGAPLVRLLLSIDRRESAASAVETVELAEELRARGVVGIDLSGEPASSSADGRRVKCRAALRIMSDALSIVAVVCRGQMRIEVAKLL